MEIYILRDGKEMGPFSEETTQSMLKQGSILINDLAWQPGMPQWIPLHSVLYPPVAATSATRPPPPPVGYSDRAAAEPVAAVINEAPPTLAEPATAKQKAFLGFMGVPFSAEITRDQAALLVNDALENPSDPGRLARWNEQRLRLHPELFRAEIQAKKENRATHFYELAQTQGAEVFRGVTKAHCQVLVGFLDVRYPSWDMNESQATWDYFFPALAEKFPQLVNKEWKGKLKFPEGPKVAPELARRAVTNRTKRRAFPAGAIVRGVITGAAILALLYFGYNYWRSHGAAKAGGLAGAEANRASRNAGATNATSNDGKTSSTAGLEKLLAQMPPPVSPGGPEPTVGTGSGTSATSPAAMNNAGPGGNGPGAASSPSNGNNSAPLFDPNATTAGTATAPGATGDATTPPPRTSVIITKPTEVALRFGRVKLPPGTVVRFVGQEGTLLKIRYGNEVVTVPAMSTDFNDLPPVPPPVPGPVPPTPPPLAPAPTIPAPGPATPPGTPPTSPTSLF
jgi:hypothetical protein